ncbi:hypothetical protein N9C75_05440 [Alphaproteobacteria bacterium]|nr:hypothetical protein [Alphaproteobacteria bacterium]
MIDDIKQIAQQIADEITQIERRERKRNSEAQTHFEYAIASIVQEVWKGTYILPELELSINKNANWYSQFPRYRDPNLTFRQTMAAYNGMQSLGLIEETKGGYLDRDYWNGELTKYIAHDKLLEMLKAISDNPFKVIKPDLDAECVILRDRINGVRTIVNYEDTPQTIKMRENLRFINSCLSRHWPDLRIKDEDYEPLQSRLNRDGDKTPIDFSQRTIIRIFSNGRFDKGGRFYRAWWQNVPSEYRKYITLDTKKTCEYDYSQLNPHMIYFQCNEDMGEEDAYDRVLNGEHRDLVKEAFNAMMQSSTPLLTKPRDLDLNDVEFDWVFLRQAIVDAHKPIEDMFFKGLGNELQYIDSCIAENLMMHYAKEDQPVLPVHDSFIMHSAFGESSELEESMRRAFYEHFKRDIPVNGEIGTTLPTIHDENKPTNANPTNVKWENIEFDYIVNYENEYSQWRDRQ